MGSVEFARFRNPAVLSPTTAFSEGWGYGGRKALFPRKRVSFPRNLRRRKRIQPSDRALNPFFVCCLRCYSLASTASVMPVQLRTFAAPGAAMSAVRQPSCRARSTAASMQAAASSSSKA